MHRNRWYFLSAFCVALAAISNRASPAAGELNLPSVATYSTYPQAHRQQLLTILQRKDCKFVKGSWLNASTQLHYHSNTEALGHFLSALAKCPGVTVSISFYRPGEEARWAPETSNWSVFHSAYNNHFQVKVNLASDEIDLTSLYIPPLKGE
jgi:hypothetical protein